MKYIYFVIPLLFLVLSAASAAPRSADTVVQGQVLAQGRPVSFALIGVMGTTYGTQANVDGTFKMEGLPPGEYTFIASSMGT